jgi:hypothetical protein
MTDPDTTADPTFFYRPSLLGAPWQFRLGEDALFWDIGRRSGSVPYRDVRRVRMSYRPVTMQSHRFVTEVWPADGTRLTIASTSWKSMVEQERLNKPYIDFIGELHRRIAASGAAVLFETGVHPLHYWLAAAVFAGAMIGLAVITIGLALHAVRTLQSGAFGGAALIAVFFAMFLWHGVNFLRRNRPRRYRPDALPGELSP